MLLLFDLKVKTLFSGQIFVVLVDAIEASKKVEEAQTQYDPERWEFPRMLEPVDFHWSLGKKFHFCSLTQTTFYKHSYEN